MENSKTITAEEMLDGIRNSFGQGLKEHGNLYGRVLTAMKDYASFQTESLRRENEEFRAILRMDEAWPLKDILSQLVKATDILLIDKGYDGNTYEEMQGCSEIAKEIISKLR